MKENTKRFLAIDYGKVRVGIAISDPTGLLARGLETIQRQGQDSLVIERIQELIDEYSISRIILGMPYRSDGKPGDKELEVKRFSKELQAKTGLRPIYQDERYSTVQAHEIMRKSKIKEKNRRDVVDQIAAEIILQDYLDGRR